jgi:predicted nucleotide-binding protein (sugar kinase/HSP70/actin superfamily)
LPQDTIIAGLYDSIIQNYLNRVKGSRPVGQVIFCQGMPFSADALAAAVARQTGSEVIIPPNPGTVGALGIALLTQRQLAWTGRPALDPRRFLEASVVQKSTFACGANTGCGGNGQHCRIDRLQTQVAGQRQTFTWGGACALHDHGARRRKLPDRAPHPFREREELVAELTATLTKQESRRRVALSDEFLLKELFPFFAAYLHELGCAITVVSGGDKATLKRGIQESHVPFCAPMQMFHGVAARLRETEADFVFAPIIRGTEHVADEPCAKVCPVVQAAPFLLQHDLAKPSTTRWLTPEIEFGADGLESASFRAGCAELARAVGATPADARRAHRAAAVVQRRFRDQCLAIGERALAFCRQHDLVPVVVLGRPYTIYNDTLNSNVPAILREQGAMAIPVDCYPVTESAPVLDRVYWGYAQRILRAARQVRQSPGVYSVYCSNYSCGPDSFNLHFYSYVMEGKPLAIIETDGHAGDAGTKTRIEAFLHCVEQDRAANRPRPATRDLHQLAATTCGFDAIDRQHETLLVPWMGVSSEIGAACLRAAGFQAQALAVPDREALRIGRRHSSGKECLPFSLTLGRLLEFMEQHPQTRCVHMVPSTNGPCRLGMYSLVQQTVVERLGLGDRCRFVSPHETNYYAGLPPGFTTVFYAGIIASVLLQDSLLAVRPTERHPGAANEIFARRHAELCSLLERQSRIITSTTATVTEVMAGRLFALPALLEEAAREWQAVQGTGGRPVVLLVGEIYVRNDGFANDNIVERLEARGLQVRCTPFNEFLDYVDHCNQQVSRPSFGNLVTQQVKQRVHRRLHQAVARHLTLPPAAHIEDTIAAAGDYLRGDIGGEAVITLGLALHEWRRKAVAAVVNVGPLECMPTRIAEAQFFHIAEREGLPSLTLAYNGDPISDDALDNFAFAVVERHSQSPAFPVGTLSKRDRLVRGDGSRFQTAPTTTP